MDHASESLSTCRPRNGSLGPLALLSAVAIGVGLTAWLAWPAAAFQHIDTKASGSHRLSSRSSEWF